MYKLTDNGFPQASQNHPSTKEWTGIYVSGANPAIDRIASAGPGSDWIIRCATPANGQAYVYDTIPDVMGMTPPVFFNVGMEFWLDPTLFTAWPANAVFTLIKLGFSSGPDQGFNAQVSNQGGVTKFRCTLYSNNDGNLQTAWTAVRVKLWNLLQLRWKWTMDADHSSHATLVVWMNNAPVATLGPVDPTGVTLDRFLVGIASAASGAAPVVRIGRVLRSTLDAFPVLHPPLHTAGDRCGLYSRGYVNSL